MSAIWKIGLACIALVVVQIINAGQSPSSPAPQAAAETASPVDDEAPGSTIADADSQRLISPLTELTIVVTITLLSSFFCSLFEAALYSITIAQTEVLKENGVFGAGKLTQLRQNIDEPITAILTVNTLSHTIGSAWSGALVGYYYGTQQVAWFAGALTFAILFLTEIIPKSMGVAYCVKIAPLMAWPLQIMIWSVWPLVKVLGVLMLKLTGNAKKIAPTEDEIIFTSRLAVRAGELRPQELRWIENALLLDTVKAYQLMTPRTVVYTLPAELKLSQVQQHSEHWNHSRLPLTEDRDPDKIVGMVYRREVFDALVRGDTDRELRQLKHDIDFIPEQMRGHQLLDKFIKEKKHMVCVVNEYGGFEGVVTLEDVLECLLGSQIVDEHDRHADLQQLARQRAQRIRESKLDAAQRLLKEKAVQTGSKSDES